MTLRKPVTIAEKPVTPIKPVDPTKSLKETILELRAAFEAEQSYSRALRAQTNNQNARNSAIAEGMKAERTDLQARIARIDLRLAALGFGFELNTSIAATTATCGSSQPNKY